MVETLAFHLVGERAGNWVAKKGERWGFARAEKLVVSMAEYLVEWKGGYSVSRMVERLVG